MRKYWEMGALLVSAVVLMSLAMPAKAELSKDVIGRIFYTPYGNCQVVPREVTINRGHVICTSEFPDVTGDGKAEQLTFIVELDINGRLKCGVYTLTDLSCPSDLLCNRTIETQRECF